MASNEQLTKIKKMNRTGKKRRKLTVLEPKHFSKQLEWAMAKRGESIDSLSQKSTIHRVTIYSYLTDDTRWIQRESAVNLANVMNFDFRIEGDKFYFVEKQDIKDLLEKANGQSSGNFDVEQIITLLKKNPDLIQNVLMFLREYDQLGADRANRLKTVGKIFDRIKEMDEQELEFLNNLFFSN